MIVQALNTAKKFATSKFRLLVEYIILGLCVAMAGLAFAMWTMWQNTDHQLEDSKKKINTLSIRVDEAERTQEENRKAIEALQSQKKIDTEVIDMLKDALVDVATQGATYTAKKGELERNDKTAKKFFADHVPPAVGCLLEPDLCPGTASGNPVQKPVR